MREFVRSALRRRGWDLHRYLPTLAGDAQLQHALRCFAVDLVLDVGANSGQFGTALRSLGYAGRILSFEPLADVHAALERNCAGDTLWSAAPRGALGREDGSITINIAGNSASSSVLPMLDSHSQAAPESRYIGQEQVPIHRLDTLLPALRGDARQIYLKIDTQGYEREVIAGAAATLAGVAAVQLEVSLTPLYGGQASFAEMLALMDGHGLAPWALWPGFAEPGTGRILQADVIFGRPDRARRP
ncbi:MAG: hypothetical protein RL490_1770 [Pseudomonadota bacterium]|jgi:FkbM family methyltransferase